MSKTADPTRSSIDDVITTNKANWIALRDEYEKLFGNINTKVLYGLPESLIDALANETTDFLTNREFQFERRLADILRAQNSIGIVCGKLVQSSLFEERKPIRVSLEDFDALGWENFGLTCNSVNRMCEQGESRALLIHEQLVAYAGWLVTNPTFLTEVTALRQREQQLLVASPDRSVAEECVCEMNAFLNRWQLAGMSTWDLPQPQGPNLSGIDWPAAATRGAESVRLEFPLTMRLPARLAIREMIAEIRDQAVQPHLAEWHQILNQESKHEPGLKTFRNILRIQFFGNIVLRSRYSERLEHNMAKLDRVFGRFLGLEDNSAKKLRLYIQRRRM